MLDNLEGIYKDYDNEKSTDDSSEWNNYKSTTPMHYIGKTFCMECGKKILVDKVCVMRVRHTIPAVCDDCKSKFMEEN